MNVQKYTKNILNTIFVLKKYIELTFAISYFTIQIFHLIMFFCQSHKNLKYGYKHKNTVLM